MRAAVFHDREDVRVGEVDLPVPRPGEALVRVAFCGLCGSDLHEYFAGPVFIPTSPHPRTGHGAPGVFGHEFSGTVVEVAPGVDGSTIAIGTRVAVNPIIACSQCSFCVAGEPHRCADIAILGNAGGPGGLAEFVRVPISQLIALPEEVSLRDAALVEPFAVVEHGLSRVSLDEVVSALVVGAGPIGLAAALTLRARGVSRVVVAEISTIRRCGLRCYSAVFCDRSMAVRPA